MLLLLTALLTAPAVALPAADTGQSMNGVTMPATRRSTNCSATESHLSGNSPRHRAPK